MCATCGKVTTISRGGNSSPKSRNNGGRISFSSSSNSGRTSNTGKPKVKLSFASRRGR